MITAQRSVMATVAVATMLATFTLSGSAADDAVPLAKCSVDAPTVTVVADGTAAEVVVAAQCVVGMLTVFKVSLKAKVTGLECKGPKAMIVPNPDFVPTWIKVSLELACKPGAEGVLKSQFAVEMLALNDVKLAAYSFGDSLVDKVATNTHGWKVNFVAGVGKLPLLDPGVPPGEQNVFGTSDPDKDDGTSQAQSDHEIQG